MTRRRTLAILCGGLCAAIPAAAQTDTTLLARGVQAYTDLELSVAVGLLNRWLDAAPAATPSDLRVRALTYLGASELLRGNDDSAAAAFSRLVRTSPRATMDPLVFPPAIVGLFGRVKNATRAVVVEAPTVFELRNGAPWTAEAWISTPHEVVAELRRLDGSTVETLYRGLVGDSVALRWNGRTTAGVTVPGGQYLVEVRSLGPTGAPVRIVQIPLDIEANATDTLAYPPQPDSLFRPERRSAGPGLEALAGGLLVGAALVVLPSRIAPSETASVGRYAVAGAISITGLIGLLTRRPGAPVAENQRFNASLRAEWQARFDSLAAENTRRRANARLVITAGAATYVDLRAQ